MAVHVSKRVVILALIMAVSTSLAAVTSITVLYDAAFDQAQERLVETVRSRARMMEAVANFDEQYSSDYLGGALEATLSQVREAQSTFQGFGTTGEFTMARLEHGNMQFILSHRHDLFDHSHLTPKAGTGGQIHNDVWLETPMEGGAHESMRRALLGQTGTLVGIDYRGVEVLTAYDSVKNLGLGVVAKIDLSEIRAPFIQAAYFVMGVVILLIASGTFMFFRLGEPFVRELEDKVKARTVRLRSIIDTAVDGIVVIDIHGIIHEFSPSAERVFGYDKNEVIGKNINILMPEPFHSAHDGYLKKYKKTRKSKVLMREREAVGKRKNGETFPIILGVADAFVKGEVYFTGSVRDISDQKKAEERLQSGLAFANVGAWDWDVVSGNLYWSEQIAPLFGHEKGSLETSYENFVAAVHPDDREKVQRAITNCIENDTPYDIEHRVVWPDGTIHWLRERGGVKRDMDGNALNMLGVVQDISDHKQMMMEQRYAQSMLEDQAKNLAGFAEEIELARSEAEEANRAKSSFLAVMSHEIRTPLNGVVGMVDMLKETSLSSDQKHMVSTVRESSLSLLYIINDILDFSKIEAGKMELDETPVLLRSIIDGCGRTFSSIALKKSVDFFIYEDPALPDRIRADGDRLRQIILNLIGNATKFTNTQDGKKGQIILSAELESSVAKAGQDWITIKVSDTGIGISEEARGKLFQSFSQADGTINRRFGGTGLGLAICQSLVDMMDGDITVESTLGKGSTFIVRLPLIPTEHAYDGDEHHDISGLRIAIASDSAVHCRYLEKYLIAASADVVVVDKLEDILPLVEKGREDNAPIDVAVIDEGWNQDTRMDEYLRPHIHNLTEHNVRCLLTRLNGQVLPPEFKGKCITLNDYPVGADAFIQGIAIAAGIESPDVLIDQEQTSVTPLPVPTVDEAELMGELILLAEDNLVNQDVIIRQLNMLGYAVIVAENGQVALDLLEHRQVGLILTDLHMPVMDGYLFAQQIRNEEASAAQQTPIIAITAAALTAELDRCFEVGMNGYVTKPLVLADLKKSLDKWLPHKEEIAKPDISREPSTEALDHSDLPVDPTMLSQIIGDDPDMQAELIADFLDTTEPLLDELDQHLATKNITEYGNLAHRLKSTVRTFGANDLGDILEELELAGKADDWSTIEKLHSKVRPGYLAVKQYYDR